MKDHVHFHKFVAQLGRYLYYECACADRRHGVSATVARATKHAALDHDWLDGARRPPREGPE